MAAGPKLICAELLKQANMAYHAFCYAKGTDVMDYEDWLYLHNTYKELSARLEQIIPSLPDGSYEDIMQQKYGLTERQKELLVKEDPRYHPDKL